MAVPVHGILLLHFVQEVYIAGHKDMVWQLLAWRVPDMLCPGEPGTNFPFWTSEGPSHALVSVTLGGHGAACCGEAREARARGEGGTEAEPGCPTPVGCQAQRICTPMWS